MGKVCMQGIVMKVSVKTHPTRFVAPARNWQSTTGLQSVTCATCRCRSMFCVEHRCRLTYLIVEADRSDVHDFFSLSSVKATDTRRLAGMRSVTGMSHSRMSLDVINRQRYLFPISSFVPLQRLQQSFCVQKLALLIPSKDHPFGI